MAITFARDAFLRQNARNGTGRHALQAQAKDATNYGRLIIVNLTPPSMLFPDIAVSKSDSTTADTTGFGTSDKAPLHALQNLGSFIPAMAKRFPMHLTVTVRYPAMIGTRPLWGYMVKTGLVIASTDPVAADVIGAKLLGFPSRPTPRASVGACCRLAGSSRGQKRGRRRRSHHDMPSMVSHPAVPLVLVPLLPQALRSPSIIFRGVVCSVLPDLDVVGFWFGVPYGHLVGHRGLSHSVAFAVFLSSACLVWLLPIEAEVQASRIMLLGFLFLSTVSHGILDALTRGD
jgi:hypothetical protein